MRLAQPCVLLVAWLLSACFSGPPPRGSQPLPKEPWAPRAPSTHQDKEDIPPEAATGLRGVQAVSSTATMVGAANPHATRAGLRMLRAGGSAVDATIAMAMVLTLVEPQSSGIGGGAFLLHFNPADRKVRAYDGRETAPAAATPDMFLDSNGQPRSFFDAVVGGLSVGTPGLLRMLEKAHRAHGKLPWAQLFEPAIKLCDEGFPISARLHALVKGDEALAKSPTARNYFYDAQGVPKAVGTALVNPELAQVFRAVARGGADAFYEGAIAEDIVKAVRAAPSNPGRLTAADLKNYQAVEREAICMPYRAFEVCGMPPPTSGGITTLQILGHLARFEPEALRFDQPLGVHLFAEASRLAYADRGLYIADPDFVAVPSDTLLSPAYLRQRAQAIAVDRVMGVVPPGEIKTGGARYAPDASLELPSTSHMVAVDADGQAVTMTASIESAFGSRQLVRGFLLNNELTDFSFLPEQEGRAVANRVQPGKRPRSSMAPVFVFKQDRQLHLALGSPGGSRIIEYVARALIEVLDGGLDIQTAIARPNVVNRGADTELERMVGQEAWIDQTTRQLTQWGHRVEVRDLNSGLQGIQRTNTGWLGGADPRREGLILGD